MLSWFITFLTATFKFYRKQLRAHTTCIHTHTNKHQWKNIYTYFNCHRKTRPKKKIKQKTNLQIIRNLETNFKDFLTLLKIFPSKISYV